MHTHTLTLTHTHTHTHTHTRRTHTHTHTRTHTHTCVSTRHVSPGRGVARARLRGCPLRWRRTRCGLVVRPGHGLATAMRLAVRQSVLQPASHPVAATPRKRPATRQQHTRARPPALQRRAPRTALRCTTRCGLAAHAARAALSHTISATNVQLASTAAGRTAKLPSKGLDLTAALEMVAS